MSTNLNEPDGPLIHVHVCVYCGNVFRREEFENRAQTTGIYLCTRCGKEGPLNIEIRTVDALETNS